MNYKALKKLIKTTSQSENKPFFFALDRELEKVNRIFNLSVRVQVLNRCSRAVCALCTSFPL